jgi:hypothetical protein
MAPTRREFLGILGALAASRLGRFEKGSKTRRFILNECFIAGFQYHDGPQLLPELRTGQSVQLVAEPDNPYDRWAVRIEHESRHIGYLPRNQNQPISRLLTQGARVECRITRVDPEALPWEAVEVQVSIRFDQSDAG